MKKLLIVVLFLVPVGASAQVDRESGVQFFTPLVQNIIRLLRERITVLQARVTELESVQCVGSNAKQRISELDTRITALKNEKLDAEKAWSERRGYAGYEIDEHNKYVNDLQYRIDKLLLERDAAVRELQVSVL